MKAANQNLNVNVPFFTVDAALTSYGFDSEKRRGYNTGKC
jgi:hypothetical protein